MMLAIMLTTLFTCEMQSATACTSCYTCNEYALRHALDTSRCNNGGPTGLSTAEGSAGTRPLQTVFYVK